MQCERCGNREFIEQTEDGPEAVCVSGHRRSLAPVRPLDISGRNSIDVKESRRKPWSGGIKI